MDERTELLHHPNSIGQAFLLALLPSLVLLLVVPAIGNAQAPVMTNITSSGLGTIVPDQSLPPPPDGVYNITGGTRPGGGPNLFHSFGIFNVGPGDTANFFNDSSLTTSNIIGRVTGGNISNIYGTIQIDQSFGSANLFLMNPSGFVFGPGASLNVGGSVSFTTAQYLRLFDSLSNTANFYAHPANDGLTNSILSILAVNPSAFEFLSASPAAYGFLTVPDPNSIITVQGSILKVPEGQSLSLVGGDITIQSGTLDDGTSQAANLQAPGGRINLVSVASPGEVPTSSFQPNGASFTTMGTVTLKEGTLLDVSGQLNFDEFGTPIGGNSGTVFVRGGQLVMDASMIQANTVGNVDGASSAVDIQVSKNATEVLYDVVLTNGSTITTLTSGRGRGGDVHITADRLKIENTSGIISSTQFGDGVGGNLFLNVGTLTATGGSEIRSTNFNFGTDLDFDGVLERLGAGGNVTIQGMPVAGSTVDPPANLVELSGGSKIISETLVNGDGGQISITAQSLNLGEASTINSSTLGTGHGGNILVRVEGASLSGGATIKTHSELFDPNAAAGGTITVEGLPGAVDSKAVSLTLTGQGSGIISETTGLARLGDITVHAKTVALMDEAVIKAGSPGDPGTAGNVTINADSVSISGRSTISSQASDADAGQVIITADRLTLDNGSIVTSTSSEFFGRGGDVVIQGGKVTLTNGAKITSESGGFSTGRAGDILITAESLTLANQSAITNSSNGTTPDAGDAGIITVKATTMTLANDSQLSSSSTGSGNAGSITIEGLASPVNTVSITDSALLTKAEGTGHGGSIRVDTTTLVLNNATISASVKDVNAADPNDSPTTGTADIALLANSMTMKNSQMTADSAGTRDAGNISINSQAAPGKMFDMFNSQINTSAALADGGNVGIYFTNMFRLTDSTITSSVGNEQIKTTKGGNITIDPSFFIAQRSGIRANAFAGTGGAIDITAGLFLADASSVVDASSTLGVSGTVQINAPINNLSEVIARLPESLIEVQALLRAACAARLAQGGASSFVERGRDSIPAGPEGLLASPYLPMASGSVAQLADPPSTTISGLQLRRVPVHETPAPVLIRSDHAACSS